MQILRHKKRSPLLSRQCCQVWRFSPRFEEFTLVMGNFSSDLEKFVSNLNFKRNKFIYGEFLRVFLILEQPTWQHCFPGSAVVVTMLFSDWSKKEASFSFLLRSHLRRWFAFRRSERREAKHVLGFCCHKASFWCAHRKPRKFFATSSQALSLLVSRQKTPKILKTAS